MLCPSFPIRTSSRRHRTGTSAGGLPQDVTLYVERSVNDPAAGNGSSYAVARTTVVGGSTAYDFNHMMARAGQPAVTYNPDNNASWSGAGQAGPLVVSNRIRRLGKLRACLSLDPPREF